MNLTIVDHTAQWREWVSAAAGRWHDALAPRGITVSYEWGDGAYVPRSLYQTPTDGLIHVAQLAGTLGHWGDTWVWPGGAWTGGEVHLYQAPTQNTEFAIAICCHELGHAFGLVDVDGGDTVMTRYPSLAYPSASDAAGAMRGYPLPVSPPPLPPGKHTGKGGKGKKHGGKHKH